MKIKLEDTVRMMDSFDYKERFRAEYYQLVIRHKKLSKMLVDWDAGNLHFIPTCPRSIYDLQLRAMKDYITILEARACIEGVLLVLVEDEDEDEEDEEGIKNE